MQQYVISNNVMEAVNHFKNGMSLKKLIVCSAVVCTSFSLWGQTASDFRAGANAGDKIDQYNLGLCYYKGNGVTKDYAQAVYWYRKAAEQGVAQAQNYLASCYYFGNGVEKDGNTALYWYEQAIKNEDESLNEKSKEFVPIFIKRLKEQGYSSSRAKVSNKPDLRPDYTVMSLN